MNYDNIKNKSFNITLINKVTVDILNELRIKYIKLQENEANINNDVIILSEIFGNDKILLEWVINRISDILNISIYFKLNETINNQTNSGQFNNMIDDNLIKKHINIFI